MHDNSALIADFGMSRQLDGSSTSDSKIKGIEAYIEPQCILQAKEKIYKRNNRSDIYSLGVLLWELTSGIPPFDGCNAVEILNKIYNHEREMSINGTPVDYINIYKKCWSDDPDERPKLVDIIEVLNRLLKTTVDFVLINKNIRNLSTKLWDIFKIETNIGKEFLQISRMIRVSIEEYQETPEIIFKLLNDEKNNNLEVKCLLGFFYFEGIGTKVNHETAYKMFEDASANIIAKFYLGECFRRGHGIKQNSKKAFLYYQDAIKAKNECSRSMNSVGLCYLNGIGTKKDYENAFKHFEESHKMGCVSACNNLGNCYTYRMGVKKSKEKAFEYYAEAAKHNIPAGQFNVANCYKRGIGTTKSLELANYWYKKAADNGYKYNNLLNKTSYKFSKITKLLS